MKASFRLLYCHNTVNLTQTWVHFTENNTKTNSPRSNTEPRKSINRQFNGNKLQHGIYKKNLFLHSSLQASVRLYVAIEIWICGKGATKGVEIS